MRNIILAQADNSRTHERLYFLFPQVCCFLSGWSSALKCSECLSILYHYIKKIHAYLYLYLCGRKKVYEKQIIKKIVKLKTVYGFYKFYIPYSSCKEKIMSNLRTFFSNIRGLDVTRVYCHDVIRGSCRVFRSSTATILARD